MPPALSIRLLGRFEVERDSLPIPAPEWRGQKTRDLLKILLLARGRYVSKDQLCDWLWPDADPDAAQINLRSVVSDLRKALEPALVRGRDSIFILTRHEGYAFQASNDLALDLAQFERLASSSAQPDLETALTLYHGDLLEEDPYAEWAGVERERLREVLLSALVRLGDLLLQDRAYIQCMTVCEQALIRDPARESVWRTLMRAQAASQDRAAALATYDRCRAALSRDLGVDPSPETIALHEEILRSDTRSPNSLNSEPSAHSSGNSQRPTGRHPLPRFGAVGLALWAIVTGAGFTLSLIGLTQNTFVSPGDPGGIALPFVQAHPQVINTLDWSIAFYFPVGWLLIPTYWGWFIALRKQASSPVLLWAGLAAGLADALTQTLGQSIAFAQLTVLPSAYLSALPEQQLSLITIWDILRQLASISGLIGLIANPLALIFLLTASRTHPRFPTPLLFSGVAIIVFSNIYYLLPPSPLALPLGISLAYSLRLWLIALASVLWLLE